MGQDSGHWLLLSLWGWLSRVRVAFRIMAIESNLQAREAHKALGQLNKLEPDEPQ